MLNCFVIDDEPSAVNILTGHVKKAPFLELIGSANDPLEALGLIRAKKIDLVFLDIQMPNLSGLDFMKLLPAETKVILTSAHKEYAADGFENQALDYLVKPISFERFLNSAQRALNNTASALSKLSEEEEQDDYFFVKTEIKGKMVKISFKDVMYIEGLKNYVSIYTKDDRIIAYLSFKELEEKLPESFMRVHKSYIIALKRIKAVEGNQIYLNGVTPTIPLGNTYKTLFFQKLHNKLMG